MRWPISVCASITLRSSSVRRPGLSMIRSGMPILPTSCIGLAIRMSSARIGVQPGEPGEEGAVEAHAHDVLACLLVAELRGP